MLQDEKPEHYTITQPYRLVIGLIADAAKEHRAVREILLAELKKWSDANPQYNKPFDEIFRDEVTAKAGTRANPIKSYTYTALDTPQDETAINAGFECAALLMAACNGDLTKALAVIDKAKQPDFLQFIADDKQRFWLYSGLDLGCKSINENQ